LELLSSVGGRRKAKLMDNSAYLQFMWKADVVESWVADKETHVRSEEYGRDLSTVQTLLTKQETFDAGNYYDIYVNSFIYLFNYYPN
jgi:spectrin alpha